MQVRLETTLEYRNQGKLVIYRRTALGKQAPTPEATIGGTVVLISTVARTDGSDYYDYTWAEGEGVIDHSIRSRNDGLREETYVSLGEKVANLYGVLIVDDAEEMSGVTKYTTTAIQAANGASPLAASLTLPRNVRFPYPGRAKAYSKNIVAAWYAYDVFLSPPVEVELPGTVTMTYQADNSLGSVGTRWQPTAWATIEAAWYGLGGYPQSHIEALRGYRSVSATPITATFGSLDTNGGTMLGQTAFGGSTGTLTVYGGPPDPGGNTYTMDAYLEVAFTSTAGTVYYRKVVVSVTVPAQSALPV